MLDRLGVAAGELVRKDKRFKELGLDAGAYGEGADRGAVVALLEAHPELMTRPIFVVGERAVVGRPSERVLELLS